MRNRFSLLLVVFAGFLVVGDSSVAARDSGQTGNATVSPARSSKELREEAFEVVWRTVKEKHFDPAFGGTDWEKARKRYAPLARSAKDDQQFYGVLQRMLGELHQSHFAIIPPEAVQEVERRTEATAGIGLGVHLIDDDAVITKVIEGGAASKAGLRPGFIIKSVDGKSTRNLTARFREVHESPGLTRLRMARAIGSSLAGAPATVVRVEYLDGEGRRRQASMTRERVTGEMSPPFGNFPAQRMEFEVRRLSNDIGYIRFNIFVTHLMERIRSAIRSLNDASGLIIDLRDNPGGIGGMSSGIAGLLCSKEASLGTMRMRTGYQNFAIFPQSGRFTGPVVILLNSGSASTSEVFAGGMQELGRAAIVGERSAGAALPSIITKLPTGALFQFAIADFRTPSGSLIEGKGVTPDVEVKLERKALLEGRDNQLEGAVKKMLELSAGRQLKRAA